MSALLRVTTPVPSAIATPAARTAAAPRKDIRIFDSMFALLNKKRWSVVRCQTLHFSSDASLHRTCSTPSHRHRAKRDVCDGINLWEELIRIAYGIRLCISEFVRNL